MTLGVTKKCHTVTLFFEKCNIKFVLIFDQRPRK